MSRYLLTGLFVSLAPVAFAACAPMSSAQTAPAAAADAAAGATSIAATYKLGVDDKVSLIVYGEQDLTKDFQIGPDGMIEVPLIGRMKAAGLTIGELSEAVRTKLADGFLRNPSVAMSIISFRPFYILGEVMKPGEYPYREGLTLAGAVATAGGYSYRAQRKRVFIRHAGSTEEAEIAVNPALAIAPGDTVRVGERYF